LAGNPSISYGGRPCDSTAGIVTAYGYDIAEQSSNCTSSENDPMAPGVTPRLVRPPIGWPQWAEEAELWLRVSEPWVRTIILEPFRRSPSGLPRGRLKSPESSIGISVTIWIYPNGATKSAKC
jgi:hypothetical protein